MQEIDWATNFVSRCHRLGRWNVGIEGVCVDRLEIDRLWMTGASLGN